MGMRRMNRAGWALAAAGLLTWAQPSWSAPGPKPAPAASRRGPGSISGLWMMQGYISSARPPRERIARTVGGQIPPMLPWAKALVEKRIAEAEAGQIYANTAFYCLPEGVPYMLFSAVIGP